ncbi:uncharacterized protein LOC111261123 [Varroa jacobsoni]|uniref:Uncharacterized protein n=1 Tax=Varroa destructor TaxID=109461 RepID=A0A7M7M744_VARDE|nr:uncharacterized protein LOC111247625 isoform X2 [Varroa destructor]XP_022690111.1 uncharacterized protein LOC111261123 [Varroa jacobsoni]
MKPTFVGCHIWVTVFLGLLVDASHVHVKRSLRVSQQIRADLIDLYVSNVCLGFGGHLDSMVFQRDLPQLMVSRQNAHKCFLGAGDISDAEIQILAMYELHYAVCKKNARNDLVESTLRADKLLQKCLQTLSILDLHLRERNAQLKQCVEFAMLSSYPVEPYDPRT